MKIKEIVTFVAGFVVGVVVLYGLGQLLSNNQDNQCSIKNFIKNIGQFDLDTTAEIKVVDDTIKEEVSTAVDVSTDIISTDMISVDTQTAGNTVLVRKVNLQAGEKGGWIAVHEISDGVVVNALGAARRESGEYVDTVVYLLRNTIKGGTYAIVLYSDDGDKQFNMKTDTPLTDDNGKYIMSIFVTQ